MGFLALDLKTKSRTSENTFRRNLCGTVIHNVHKSKVETDLAFFLTLIYLAL